MNDSVLRADGAPDGFGRDWVAGPQVHDAEPKPPLLSALPSTLSSSLHKAAVPGCFVPSLHVQIFDKTCAVVLKS